MSWQRYAERGARSSCSAIRRRKATGRDLSTSASLPTGANANRHRDGCRWSRVVRIISGQLDDSRAFGDGHTGNPVIADLMTGGQRQNAHPPRYSCVTTRERRALQVAERSEERRVGKEDRLRW